jgi:hypothetical protein
MKSANLNGKMKRVPQTRDSAHLPQGTTTKKEPLSTKREVFD